MNLFRFVWNKAKGMEIKSRQILTNTIGAFLVRGLGLFVSLFTMPAYMRYFDNQVVLGLWFTVLSVLNWILTFDLGIGNGLRNRLVEPIINNDMKKAKKYISSAYVMSLIVVIIGVIVGFTIFPIINWNTIFNISEDIVSAKVLLEVVQLVFTGIILQFLFKLVTSVLYALQKSAIPGLLSLISSVLLLSFVLLSNSSDMETNLITLAKINVLTSNTPLLVASVIIFATILKKCTPNIRYFNKKYALDVMKLGGIFFWLQIMYMIIANTNEFLITWLAGPENVVNYQVYNKLFTLAGTIFNLALTPIWSAVTKAFAEQDFVWLKKIYKKLQLLAFASMFMEFSLIIFLQILINVWLGENAIKVNYVYAFIFAVSGSIFIWNGAISSIINGIGKLKIQFIWLTLGAVINIPLSYVIYSITGNWIAVVIANILALLPYCIIQPLWIRKYFNRKLNSNSLI